MKSPVNSPTKTCSVTRTMPELMVWLICLTLLVVISLGCSVPQKTKVAPTATRPGGAVQPVKQKGFEKTDCTVAGVTFTDITVNYFVDDNYDGPYLICNSSSTGAHGLSEHAYIKITAYKTGKLDEPFRQSKESIQRFVDQANEWNADPNVPAEAKDEVTFIHNDQDRYVFMITQEANVQGCLLGSGYGEEMINGKYQVSLSFQSCELSDTAAYVTMLQNLESAALTAIQRIEKLKSP